MIRVAIVEDNLAYSQQLQDYIRRFAQESGETIQISVFPDGMDIVEEYHPVYDLLLMDIEMPHLNGMDAAMRIRAIDPAVLIIFITNMAQYAIKGYEVDALDYVLKPISYFAFAMKMRKAVRIVQNRTRKSILVSWNNDVRRLPSDSILYIEVVDHHLHFFTEDEEYKSIGSLKELEKELAAEHFCLCNRCYLVNLKYVEGISQDDVVVGKHRLKMSRAKKKAFTQQLSDYYSHGGW